MNSGGLIFILAPRIHKNIIGRLELLISSNNVIRVYTSNGRYTFNSLGDLYSYLNETDLKIRSSKDRDYFNSSLSLLMFVKDVVFAKLYQKNVCVVCRDLYSIPKFIYFLVLKFIGVKITLVYQFPLYTEKIRLKSFYYYRFLSLFFRIESNVLGEGVKRNIGVFAPLLVSQYSLEIGEIKSTKDRGSCVMISKYQNRKRIIESLEVLTKHFSKITVIGEVWDMNYYNRCVQLFGNSVYFYCNLNYISTLEILRKSEVYILNSIDEPAAFSPLEAMAFNCDVYVRLGTGTDTYYNNNLCKFKELIEINRFDYESNMNCRNLLKDQTLFLRKYFYDGSCNF